MEQDNMASTTTTAPEKEEEEEVVGTEVVATTSRQQQQQQQDDHETQAMIVDDNSNYNHKRCRGSLQDVSSRNNNTNTNNEEEEEESRSLMYILDGQCTSSKFFDTIWQEKCAIFTTTRAAKSNKTTTTADNSDNTDNPFCRLIDHGFDVLTDLMQQRQQPMMQGGSNNNNNSSSIYEPLLFRNQQLLTMEERELYSYHDDDNDNNNSDHHRQPQVNLWDAYLDGCSIVMNHADVVSSDIAQLCNDLQLSFPHVYANVYMTPPSSQTVPPHADDRDVFIVQVVGTKEWIVYETVPIPYPYPHEQVGKDTETLPVPTSVVSGPILFQTVLSPGDVLYMPRGYVHEAHTTRDCSFHVTLAIATHDWSLSKLLSTACQSILMSQQPFRKAVDRHWGRSLDIHSATTSKQQEQLQTQLNHAMQLLQKEFTIHTINEALYYKYQHHNQRAAMLRSRVLLQHPPSYNNNAMGTTTNPMMNAAVVGREAAAFVTLSTRIRAATPQEKEGLIRMQQQEQQRRRRNGNDRDSTTERMISDDEAPSSQQRRRRGLNVRAEIHTDIVTMIQYLQQNPTISIPVHNLLSLITDASPSSMCCDLTLLCMARRCVELGALAICKTDS